MKRLILIIPLALFTALATEQHACRWKLCPYKHITPNQWKEAVIEYAGEEGTDGYHIDILHLQHPEKDADELHDLLFNNQ